MSTAVARIKAEPAVVVSLVSALLALAVAFGAHLSGEQIAAIVAPIQIVAGLFIRSKVTPVTDTQVAE